MYYIYMPPEMRNQIVLDLHAIKLLEFGYESEKRQVSGKWETFHGELYVTESRTPKGENTSQ